MLAHSHHRKTLATGSFCPGYRTAIALLGLLLYLAASAQARANPKAAPFTYPYMTLQKGAAEFEQYVDLSPMRMAREDPDGTTEVTSVRSILQTELEYGITDRLEFGFYLMFKQGAAPNVPFMRFQGIKQRLRYRFVDPGRWPIDVGLYLELAIFHNEFELEQKVILSKRFGRFVATANLWIEQEYYWQTKEFKLLYNPTLALTYEFSPNFMLSFEGWIRGRLDERRGPSDFDNRSDSPINTNPYVGPAAMVQSGRFWFTVGAYARMRQPGRYTGLADPWGPFWLRTLVGIGM